jgi:hypothetical protein
MFGRLLLEQKLKVQVLELVFLMTNTWKSGNPCRHKFFSTKSRVKSFA